MSLSIEALKKIAILARLNLQDEDLNRYPNQLSNILDFIAQMNQIDTTNIEPIAHPLDVHVRFRQDGVTEVNQREKFQQLAPKVEAGLYLVPQVIE